MTKEQKLLSNVRRKCNELIEDIRQAEHNTELTRIINIQKMEVINEIIKELYE